MTLLSWQTALLVGGIAVPLLILLYFLKLRRRERRISSTLLWKRAVHDLQVNAPFQRLRRNLLLFLQLLILLAVLLALAQPVMNFVRQREQTIVLLIDRSGSMKTIEADKRTRMDHACDAAADFVSKLPAGSRAMVISFADRAEVVCSFTDDKRRLARLIHGIEPTEACSKIGEALQLAVAYSASLIDERSGGLPESAQQGAADIELFSDGRISDADQQFVTRGQMRYYMIGAAGDNVGIVACNIRRHFENPGVLSVFAEVENFGPAAAKTDASILINGKLVAGSGAVKEIALGPAVPTTNGPNPASPATETPALPARQTVLFEMQHEVGGILELRLHREDALSIDNSVFMPVDPPRQARVLAVSDRDESEYFLRRGFSDALTIHDFKLISPAKYEAAPDADLIAEGRSAYDLVVIAGHDTARLPPGNYLFFAGLPKVEGVSRGEDIEGRVLAVWNENHPLLRNVHLENVFIAKWKRLRLPEHAVKLVEGEDSVVMALLTDPGHRYLITAFDLADSNFPMQVAFPVFLQNAVMVLAGGGLMDEGRLLRPGDTLNIPVPHAATTAAIERPDGTLEELQVQNRHILTYARTHQAGVYRAKFDDPAKTVEVFGANLLDRVESHVAPNDAFKIGSEQVATAGGEVKVNEPLWPWAVAAALLVLLLEWWIYNKRVMI